MSEPVLMVSRGEKAIVDDEGHISGWLAPFGGPRKGRDLEGEYFAKDTDFALDDYTTLPILWRHGRDPEVGRSKLGDVTVKEIRDKGLWIEGNLNRQSQYYDALRELASQGDLYWSSGSDPNWVRKDAKTGKLKEWPLREATLTLTPVNPEANAFLKDFMTAEKGWLPEGTSQGDLDDGDFAWLASDKTLSDTDRRKLPYKIHGAVNEAGWRAAWSRANQSGTDFSGGPSQSAVLAKLKKDKPEGIETADDEPDSDADDAKEIARITAIVRRLDAGKAMPAMPPDVAQDIHDHAHLAHEFTTNMGANCPGDGKDVKEGRAISSSTMGQIQAIHDQTHLVHDATGAIGADCPGFGKSLELPPAPVLAIAGNDVVTVSDADLAAMKSMFRDVAVAEAKRVLGRT